MVSSKSQCLEFDFLRSKIIQHLRNEINVANEKNKILGEKNQNLYSQMKKYEKIVPQLKTRLQKMTHKYRKSQNEMEKKNHNFEEFEIKVTKLEEQNDEYKLQIDENVETLNKKKCQILKLKDELESICQAKLKFEVQQRNEIQILTKKKDEEIVNLKSL